MYLLPKPKKIEELPGSFFINYDTRIVLDPVMENGTVYAGILKECLEKWAGYSCMAVKGQADAGNLVLGYEKEFSPQEYCLQILPEKVSIRGGAGAGVLYGVQTLCQIIEQSGSKLPCMEIHDYPDILYRGYYLDQTRGRVMKLSALKQEADRLCRYKINEFQLYVEHTYLFAGLSEMWRDETPLTAEEIMELDAYCKARHIELIPSLASFGHLYTLLSTKSYGELCELENSYSQPFSLVDRMRHHTVNVTDERVLPLIKGMLTEYMALFSSDKFNFCADETFDLGKGRAKALAEQVGVHRIYIDYVKELSTFFIEKGKTPMFWGDVISQWPEFIKELPEELICLTWGYAPDQGPQESRRMAELSAKQYLCPGVQGWNRWMNHLRYAYENIQRMCSYGKQYEAIGIMNTDWGDYGHVNCPEFSIPGMIYGAAFSWGGIESFDEINRQISRMEYHDRSETLTSAMAEICEYALFDWFDAVIYYERTQLGEKEISFSDRVKLLEKEKVLAAGRGLAQLRLKIKEASASMDSRDRKRLYAYDLILQGFCIWNEIGNVVLAERITEEKKEVCYGLAAELETWFMYYKELWRETCKEGDLHHVAEIIFWYADLLRGRKRQLKHTEM